MRIFFGNGVNSAGLQSSLVAIEMICTLHYLWLGWSRLVTALGVRICSFVFSI